MGREVRKVPASWQHPASPEGWPVPLDADDMPQWTETEATHFQMYENVTEGTPISPVMDTSGAFPGAKITREAAAVCWRSKASTARAGGC